MPKSKTPKPKISKQNTKKSLKNVANNDCVKSTKEPILERVNEAFLSQLLAKIGTEKMGAKIMQKKGEITTFVLKDLSLPALNILKQEALSAGGDLATPKEAILGKQQSYNALLIATKTQLEKIIYKCKIQPFGLKKIANKLESHIATKSSQIHNLKNKIIMPIINITPDSFYADSRHSTKQAIDSIIALVESGATLIDIGAASSRPNSELIEPNEEKKAT